MRNDYIVGKGDVIFMLQYLMKPFFIIRSLFSVSAVIVSSCWDNYEYCVA